MSLLQELSSFSSDSNPSPPPSLPPSNPLKITTRWGCEGAGGFMVRQCVHIFNLKGFIIQFVEKVFTLVYEFNDQLKD